MDRGRAEYGESSRLPHRRAQRPVVARRRGDAAGGRGCDRGRVVAGAHDVAHARPCSRCQAGRRSGRRCIVRRCWRSCASSAARCASRSAARTGAASGLEVVLIVVGHARGRRGRAARGPDRDPGARPVSRLGYPSPLVWRCVTSVAIGLGRAQRSPRSRSRSASRWRSLPPRQQRRTTPALGNLSSTQLLVHPSDQTDPGVPDAATIAQFRTGVDEIAASLPGSATTRLDIAVDPKAAAAQPVGGTSRDRDRSTGGRGIGVRRAPCMSLTRDCSRRTDSTPQRARGQGHRDL